MKKKKLLKRRHFQLLELMVAVVILLLCITPSMRILTNIFTSQQDIVRENKKDHFVHMIHAKFTELLYKRMISFDDVREEKEISLGDEDLERDIEKAFFQYSGKFSIKGLPSKKKEGEINPDEKPPKYLCKLQITMHDKLAKSAENNIESPYVYYIFIDTDAKDGGEDEEDEDDEDKSESDEENGDEDEEDEEEDDDEEEDSPPVKGPVKKPASKIAKGGA